ncbi:uncharacterized protein LOC131149575 isoform X2 [Malania oleifera]|uniref:uncharacterized protein LOC131149575 isoform X2 n=1 Tax=Malania oleifera TaxID=397392 RepID=UPI0025AE33C8|nr:uncharacterized protein LOC131149575 isoform X2 [Malania oleifera]
MAQNPSPPREALVPQTHPNSLTSTRSSDAFDATYDGLNRSSTIVASISTRIYLSSLRSSLPQSPLIFDFFKICSATNNLPNTGDWITSHLGPHLASLGHDTTRHGSISWGSNPGIDLDDADNEVMSWYSKKKGAEEAPTQYWGAYSDRHSSRLHLPPHARPLVHSLDTGAW